ncbi:hypothetical protein MMC10_001091 [Thelotrema lepadinum]|nr:hypothetical protein [Thelotrema lepadinum]
MDILSPPLTLESTLYFQGHALGTSDGSRAGLIKGRAFGLEKGFEKFSFMGRLHGRAVVWSARLPLSPSAELDLETDTERSGGGGKVGEAGRAAVEERGRAEEWGSKMGKVEVEVDESLLPPPGRGGDRAEEMGKVLPDLEVSGGKEERVRRHLGALLALTEMETLALENTEEGVADFEGRFRRAVAKGGIVGKMVGEEVDFGVGEGGRVVDGEGALEEIGRGLRSGGGKVGIEGPGGEGGEGGGAELEMEWEIK